MFIVLLFHRSNDTLHQPWSRSRLAAASPRRCSRLLLPLWRDVNICWTQQKIMTHSERTRSVFQLMPPLCERKSLFWGTFTQTQSYDDYNTSLTQQMFQLGKTSSPHSICLPVSPPPSPHTHTPSPLQAGGHISTRQQLSSFLFGAAADPQKLPGSVSPTYLTKVMVLCYPLSRHAAKTNWDEFGRRGCLCRITLHHQTCEIPQWS